MTWDTLLVDGVDLVRPDRIVESFDVGGATGSRGSNYQVPGRDGSVWLAKPREESTVQLGVTVTAVDPATGLEPSSPDGKLAQFNQNWNDLVRLVKPRRRQLVLSRRMSLPAGVEHTVDANVEVLAALPQSRLNAYTARTVINFRNMDGCWFDEVASSFDLVPGSNFVPVSGSTDSFAVSVSLRATVAGVQSLRNVSTGVEFSYDWAADRLGSTVVVDASTFTVYRYPTPGSNARVVSLLSFDHSGDLRFMVVDPSVGVNEFVLSGGTASLSYRGAWL